jgi:general secretion pathway protein A
MYLDFFGLTKNPFQMIPDDELLYMSEQHARALVYMDYAAWQPGGFVVITGEIGSGKTTLVRWLLNKSQGFANILSVEFTNFTGNDLFNNLLRQANVIPKKEDKISLIYTLRDYLKRLSKNGKPCVLIIDEAQNLTYEQLEDIRMLAALEGDSGPLLRITLLAQPEFYEKIKSMEQFKQRVKLHYHLGGLSREDITKYVEYRLIKSGLNENNIFSKSVLDKIFIISRGIPRLINKICDALLMCAYAEESKLIKVEDLDSILPDLMIDDPFSELNNKRESDPCINDDSIVNNHDLLERFVNAVEDLNRNLSSMSGKRNS